jgi:tetratricopeptide (TPR) repeat protein
VFVSARQYDRAIEEGRKAVERNPNFPGAHRILADAYAAKKMTREAIAEYQAMAGLAGRTPWGLVGLTRAQALEGRRSEALRTIEEMKTLATSRYVSPAFIAMGFQILGDKDQALNWWAKACEDHSVDVRYLKVDPMNDNLRDDPRFADLLRKARLGP